MRGLLLMMHSDGSNDVMREMGPGAIRHACEMAADLQCESMRAHAPCARRAYDQAFDEYRRRSASEAPQPVNMEKILVRVHQTTCRRDWTDAVMWGK